LALDDLTARPGVAGKYKTSPIYTKSYDGTTPVLDKSGHGIFRQRFRGRDQYKH
jgi:hypothetical protein